MSRVLVRLAVNARRTLVGVSAAALVFTLAACGSDAADEVGGTTDDTVQADQATDSTTADDTAAPPDAAPPDEVGEVGPTACSDAPEEWSQVLDEAAPPAPAPGGLTVGMVPTDTDAAIALFGALPDELIGGTKAAPEGLPPGLVEVNYQMPDRVSRDGFQAHDLRIGMLGSILPEPRADLLVGFFVVSDDDDYTVEAAGHDGDLYWVTYITTNSGVGIDGIEKVFTITWGEACSPLGFSASAPTEAGRDELVAAFIEAAANQ